MISTLTFAGSLVIGLIMQLLAGRMAERRAGFGELWYGLMTVVAVAISAVELARRDWLVSVFLAVCALANGWMWWQYHKRRRRKRRVLALMGAKSRALIGRLVLRQREAVQPH
jgi:uncharacterized membrane protein HdeD (DUF308 family)